MPVTVHEQAHSSIAPGDFVVVRKGEGLYTRAESRARVATIHPERTQGVLRVLAVSGQWVELVTDQQRHCADPLDPEWAEVRLFVPLSALARVTRKEFSAEYEDGTRVRLSAGLPVGDGTLRVALTDHWLVELPVELPTSAIGLSYLDHEPMVVAGPPGGHLARTAAATLGAKRFEMPEGVDLLGGTPSAGGYRVGIVGRCVDAEILVSESDVVPPADRSAVVRDGNRVDEVLETDESVPEKLYRIAAGAQIHWPSGAPAGRVIKTAVLRDEPDRAGDLICFDPQGECWSDAARFCFDPKAIAEEPGSHEVER